MRNCDWKRDWSGAVNHGKLKVSELSVGIGSREIRGRLPYLGGWLVGGVWIS
jgi:hypothetical protein